MIMYQHFLKKRMAPQETEKKKSIRHKDKPDMMPGNQKDTRRNDKIAKSEKLGDTYDCSIIVILTNSNSLCFLPHARRRGQLDLGARAQQTPTRSYLAPNAWSSRSFRGSRMVQIRRKEIRFSATWYQNTTEPGGVVEDDVVLGGCEVKGR